jgi:hypothetical protein
MKQTNQSATGTSFHRCTVTATLGELISILGKPMTGDIQDKVTYEWEMETDTGDVFTVYDWKEYRAIGYDEMIGWHIVAHTAAEVIQAQVELTTLLTSLRKF